MSTEVLLEATPVPPASVRRPGKRAILIASAAAALAAAGGYVLLGGDQAADAEVQSEMSAEAKESADYIEAPEMVVNLRAADGATRFLKLRFMIVPASPGKSEAIRAKLPLIIDSYQPFLRELRPEDLAGSAAIFRIKEEMMARATARLGAGTIKDVLIQDIVQQ